MEPIKIALIDDLEDELFLYSRAIKKKFPDIKCITINPHDYKTVEELTSKNNLMQASGIITDCNYKYTLIKSHQLIEHLITSRYSPSILYCHSTNPKEKELIEAGLLKDHITPKDNGPYPNLERIVKEILINQ